MINFFTLFIYILLLHLIYFLILIFFQGRNRYCPINFEPTSDTLISKYFPTTSTSTSTTAAAAAAEAAEPNQNNESTTTTSMSYQASRQQNDIESNQNATIKLIWELLGCDKFIIDLIDSYQLKNHSESLVSINRLTEYYEHEYHIILYCNFIYCIFY